MGKLLKTLAVTSLGLTMVACGNQSVDEQSVSVITEIQDEVTIDFWHSMSGAQGDTLAEIVDNFNSTIGKEKGINVVATYQGGYSDAKAKMIASLKAGTAPEITQGTLGDIMEYISSGFVQPLDEYVFHDEIGIKDFDDILEVYRKESSNYTDDNQIYSLPFAKSTDLLFYNETFFTENNLEVPTTWDELTEVSTKIKEITGKPGFSIDNTANYLITLLNQTGGDYTTREGDVLVSNDIAVDILELIQTNIENGVWRTAGEDGYSSGPFLSENVYMYIGSSAGSAFLTRDYFNWEATMIPQADKDNIACISQGNNIALISQNKSSEEVYGAYEFAKYLVSYDANLKWSTETGYLPIRESVANSSEYQAIMEANSDKQSAVESSKYGYTEAVFIKNNISSGIVRSVVGEAVESVILNGTDPKEALDYAVERLQNY